MLISIGISVALGAYRIVKTATAIESPLTQEEARVVSEITNRAIGVRVNEEERREVIGVGFATDGNDATGTGGVVVVAVGLGYGGDVEGIL